MPVDVAGTVGDTRGMETGDALAFTVPKGVICSLEGLKHALNIKMHRQRTDSVSDRSPIIQEHGLK